MNYPLVIALESLEQPVILFKLELQDTPNRLSHKSVYKPVINR